MSAARVDGSLRNLRAEWARVWSVRSTVILLALTAAGVVALAAIAASQSASTAPVGGSPWQLAGFLSLPSLLGTLVFLAVAATADHTTGGITPTLQWTPRRGILLTVRTFALTLISTSVGVLLAAAAAAVIWFFAPQLTFLAPDLLERVGAVALVFATGAILTVGVGLATRNAAATLAVVFSLMLIGPLLLQVVPFAWATRLIEILPGAAALLLLLGEGPGDAVLTTGGAAATLLLWAAAALALGSARLLRSAAGR